MTDFQLLQRIVSDPRIMVGKPTIKGTRLTVDFVLKLLANGASVDEVVSEYHGLEREDVQACLLFASQSVSHLSFLPLTAESEKV
jgi:uncharacterized protein (DUF433 family)